MKHTRKDMISYLKANRPDIPASNWDFYSDDELQRQCELMHRWVVQHLNDALAMG